jgi:hypothetical protein
MDNGDSPRCGGLNHRRHPRSPSIDDTEERQRRYRPEQAHARDDLSRQMVTSLACGGTGGHAQSRCHGAPHGMNDAEDGSSRATPAAPPVLEVI